jgi:hypothetical protein
MMAMTLKELEAEVMGLKKQLAEYSYVKDYIEIWQLMSTYSHLYHVFKRSEIPALFAQKTPGVSVEIEDGGVYEGLEGVNKVFCGILGEKRNMVPGFLGVHMTVNPVLQINKKRTRAKGLWHSHGSVTLRFNDRLTSFWCLGKYDMEYVKEDGKWKFLKFAYRLTYMAPYEKGWVEEPQGASITAGHLVYPPDKPSTYHMPYNRYRINIFQPPPPEPYED